MSGEDNLTRLLFGDVPESTDRHQPDLEDTLVPQTPFRRAGELAEDYFERRYGGDER